MNDLTPRGARSISIGRYRVWTRKSVSEIAAARAARLDRWMDERLFLSTFDRVRKVAPALAHLPLDLEAVCTEFTQHSAVMEAAMIEALASLRAEGMRL